MNKQTSLFPDQPRPEGGVNEARPRKAGNDDTPKGWRKVKGWEWLILGNRYLLRRCNNTWVERELVSVGTSVDKKTRVRWAIFRGEGGPGGEGAGVPTTVTRYQIIAERKVQDDTKDQSSE